MTPSGWRFGLSLDRRDDLPLFVQIAAAITDDICRGRLRPGETLPGTRTLADALGVDRVTTVAAYAELGAEGWILSAPGRRPRVNPRMPEAVRRPPAADQRAGLPRPRYPLPRPRSAARWPLPRAGELRLHSWPDTRLIRLDPIARAYRRALRRDGPRLLAYGDPRGWPVLRQALAGMLAATRAMAARADDILVTRGSQMALSLVARTLIGRGKRIAVETPGYPLAWEAFRQAGAVPVAVPVDGEGLDVDALERASRSPGLAAVYVTPHHQMPTTVTMSPERRTRLLDLARRRRLLVIEDDYDDAFHFDARPVMPLASLDRAGVVVYVGTLSKVFAPGLRLGYVVAPAAVVDRLAADRQFLDVHGDPLAETVMAALIESGEVQRHLRRVKHLYAERRELFARLLRELPDAPLAFDLPPGGVAFWVRATAGIDIDAWAARAASRGLHFLTARAFTFDRRPRPFARLGFASLTAAEIGRAVETLDATRNGAPRGRRR